MLHHKPRFTYSGLTVVLSNPSRFDRVNLLSANGGRLFDELLSPEYNRFQCDIRLKEDSSPLLPCTKVILLLGEPAMKLWTRNIDNTLGQMRGSLFWYDGFLTQQYGCHIAMIASFYPQDATDIQNYEKEFNSHGGRDDEDVSDDSQESAVATKSRHGRTKRKNYRFWLKQDLNKIKYLLKNDGQPPLNNPKPNYVLNPKSEEVIDILTSTKEKELYIDIETDVPHCNLQCLSFSYGLSTPILSLPIFNPDDSWSYSNLPSIFRALAIAFNQNTVIAHNGAAFDFLVFSWKYHIPVGPKLYDTMIAHHRCYSDVEKSLGHCTSLYTWEPFHKDEGSSGWGNFAQMQQRLQYCAKDVYTMMLVKKGIDEYASKIPGLQLSIDSANAAIRPYLITTLQGIQYDELERQAVVKENDALMMHYIRWLDILIGKDSLKEIRGKGKSSLPSSNKQCCEYFHNLLGYPVVARGEMRQDGSRAPSLGKKAMYKLRLKHDNPVIDIVLAYRECAKESSSLGFIPWKD